MKTDQTEVVLEYMLSSPMAKSDFIHTVSMREWQANKIVVEEM
jgi:hypothetical protein